MMKNLLIVFTVLAMASTASAGLVLSVNGAIDPPDTEITIAPSDIVIIDIHNVGDPIIGVAAFLSLHASGPGTLSFGSYENFINPGIPAIELAPGVFLLDFAQPNPDFRIPVGIVADFIEFHCDDIGDVTITLSADPGGQVILDQQVIHQVPEPITFALLGLGGLFLRRRK